MPRAVQLWRTGRSATPDWEFLVEAIDPTTPLAAYARPGAFNDPDMLEIGNGSLTEGEQRVHFAVWSILAAPLFAGNDLSTMGETTRAILTNSAIIALDQDPLGLQGAVVRREGDVEVLAKPLAGCGARGVVLWNRGTNAARVTLRWSDLWLTESPATVEDLWNHTELDSDATSIELEVPGHDALALRVTGGEPALPVGEAFMSDLDWTYAVNGFGPVERDTSNGEEAPGDGSVMSLRGGVHDKGLGVHAPSLIRYRLGQKCTRFVADVGIDDEVAGVGSVRFEVWADGAKLFESGLLTGQSPPRRVDVDLTDRRELRLFVDTGGDTYEFDHANWASARFFCNEDP
jgi:alpha-galactosidase